MGEGTISLGQVVVTEPDGSRRCTCGRFNLPVEFIGDDGGDAAVSAHLATHAADHDPESSP